VQHEDRELHNMQDALIIQRPAAQGAAPQELVLLFHGVGASAKNLEPLGSFLAQWRPQAWIVCVQAPLVTESGRGRQWFSVMGITEANRPARVVEAMPRFVDTVTSWQRHAGADAASTTLIGFSQGAIMALESTQQGQGLAGHVVAIAGRFAQAPRQAPAGTVVHLMHGEQDRVMPMALAVEGASALRALGASVTLDAFPGLDHGVDERVARRIGECLDAPALSAPSA
jgi:phospholipase/carboxylesterase